MPLLKRKRVLAAKVESVIGTAETLTASEGAFNAYDVMIQPSIEVEQREAQGAFNYLSGVPGARTGTATFKTDIGYDGTGTAPTWASVLLPGCGIVESSLVYTPRTEAPGSNVKTLTIGCYIDGKLRQLSGAVGNFTLTGVSGKMATIEWEFQGVYSADTDTAIIAPTYPTALPLRFASATCEFASVSQVVEQFTFTPGNQIVMREDPTTAGGYISGIITNREPRITCNPEAVLVATQDRVGQWLAGTEAAFTVAVNGPAPVASTSTLTLTAPKAQIIADAEGDRNRIVTDELEFSCNKNGTSNDQEFNLTFVASAL